jgi:hypothetical protein
LDFDVETLKYSLVDEKTYGEKTSKIIGYNTSKGRLS